MSNVSTRCLLMMLLFSMSKMGLSAIALQTFYGVGKGDLGSFDSEGTLLTTGFTTEKAAIEAHLAPSKNIPITIGLFYSNFSGKAKIISASVQEIRGFEYGWDVLTWTDVKGFGVSFRYGEALDGQYQFFINDQLEEQVKTHNIKNRFVGIGLATPVSKDFGILVEYRQRISSSFSVASNKDTKVFSPQSFGGGVLMLGAEVSI